MKLLITGGAGFIGSAVVRQYIRETDGTVVTLDNLTYAGTTDSLEDVLRHPRHVFEKVDICDRRELDRVFRQHQPNAVMHLAAESHVDRSIETPAQFIQTNIIGTYNLLEATLAYWSELTGDAKICFRFHHVSTDEVYGSLGPSGVFTEESQYRPNSPYSASKAASDHLVRSWCRTYGLPAVISNCSNNYGPYQFPEKLIPLVILNALEGKPLPIYGQGDNVRDWLYVEDHARALRLILAHGRAGETYHIGGQNERTNLDIVHTICEILDEFLPNSTWRPHAQLICFVEDRPGHDKRYAIDASKIRRELGWEPQETFNSGIRKTVRWYLDNQHWCRRAQGGCYQRERLGLIGRNTQ